MASTIKTLYGTSNQGITCSLASLTTGSRRGSLAVDNTTNLFLDVLVMLKVKTGASGVTASGYVEVFAYGTADGGTTYSDGVGGTDAGVTLTNPVNVKLIGIVNAVANATTYVGGPFSVAAAFGGVLPQKWGIVVGNQTGGTFDTTEGNFAKFYQGIQGQTV